MCLPEALGCGIKKKNPSAKSEIPPIKLFIKSVLETPLPQTIQYIAIVLHYSLELC